LEIRENGQRDFEKKLRVKNTQEKKDLENFKVKSKKRGSHGV
jgi:hypothetical protein